MVTRRRRQAHDLPRGWRRTPSTGVAEPACRRPCRTARLPLVGAAAGARWRAVAAPARLVRRYGTEAPAVVALADGRPELLEPGRPGRAVLGVELLLGACATSAR